MKINPSSKGEAMLNNYSIPTGETINMMLSKEKCNKCNRCLEACPLIRCLGFKTLEEVELRHMCLRCYACMAVCPHQAITIDGMVATSPVAPIPSSAEMLNLIKQRRSTRAFRSQPVKPADWEKLLEVVRYSPTGHNVQDIDIMIIQSPQVLNKLVQAGKELIRTLSQRINRPIFSSIYKRMLGAQTYSVFSTSVRFYPRLAEMLAEGEDPFLFHAPAIMLFLGPKSEFMAKTEADLAAQSVALCAPTLGLATCYSGIVSASFSGMYPAIKKIVKIPEGYAVHNALIVGYPKHSPSYVPHRRERNVYYS